MTLDAIADALIGGVAFAAAAVNRTRRHSRETAAVLSAAAEELAAATSLEKVQFIVRTTARALAGADGATFVLRDGDRCFYADEDAMSPLWKGQRFPLSECISGWAMLNNDIAIIPDIVVDPRIPQDAYRPTFVKSLAMVPVGDPPVAAIGVYWATPAACSPAAVEAVRQLASLTAQAFERLGDDTAGPS